GQERNRLLGLVEQPIAMPQQLDAVLVLAQGGTQVGLAALKLLHDPLEPGQGLLERAFGYVRHGSIGTPDWPGGPADAPRPTFGSRAAIHPTLQRPGRLG